MKKKALIASIATAGVAASVLVGGVTFAQTATQTTNPSANLAQAIASKFNLNKDDVAKVIEEQHQSHMNDRLTQAVKDGKLTEDQKNKIVAKHAEMKPKFEAARAETDDAKRKAAMDALHKEMQQWAKENNIPKGFGMMGPGGRGHKGPGGMGMHGGPGGQEKGDNAPQLEQ